jgi:hypothetical protein
VPPRAERADVLLLGKLADPVLLAQVSLILGPDARLEGAVGADERILQVFNTGTGRGETSG